MGLHASYDPAVEAVQLLILGGAALGAGFIDAVAGGGGLITTPSLLLTLPEAPLAALLGSNKCVSIVGTTAAAVTYAKRVALDRGLLIPAVALAIPAAALGAALVSRLPAGAVKPAIVVALCVVAVYTAVRPKLGQQSSSGLPARWRPLLAGALGALIGFYDGLLGPGTGSFLALGLIGIAGFDFLRAATHARIINGATNLGALLWFVWHGSVVWQVVPLMAVCNLVGGVLGSRMALARGNAWVRRIFLAVVTVLILRLAWSLYST